MIVARCVMVDGDFTDMRVGDEDEVDRVRSAIVEIQMRRDPLAGAKAMFDQQQQNIAQTMQAVAAAVMAEGGPEQAQAQSAEGAALVFDQLMERFPAPPEGIGYVVASSGLRGWLTPEGAMQVRTVEAVQLPAGRP